MGMGSAEGTGIWKMPNPHAGSVRYVAQPSLAAGSGGFPAAGFKNSVQMPRVGRTQGKSLDMRMSLAI